MIRKSKIRALACKLEAVPQPLTDHALMEIENEIEDYIGYNSRYASYYDFDFSADCTYPACVLQAVEDYQVLRFFDVDVYSSGEGMRKYYEDTTNGIENDDCEEYWDEMEVRECTECRRVWIAPNGDTEVEKLHSSLCEDEYRFVNVFALQDWVHEPTKRNLLLSLIGEEKEYIYTESKPTLAFWLQSETEYLQKNEKEFFDLLVEHEWYEEVSKYYRAFRVAHRHGFHFPTDYQTARMYLDYLGWLKMDDPVYLTQPYYVAPQDFTAMYNRWSKRKAELKEAEEKRKTAQLEDAFRAQHSYLFGIEFDSKHLHFQSLDSVEAYRQEGKIMHHCIYRCKYYDHPYDLSMHVSDHEGNRVATCTVDVEKRYIKEIQPMGNAVGYRNTYHAEWTDTKEYKEIHRALMAHMAEFPTKQQKETNINLSNVA